MLMLHDSKTERELLIGLDTKMEAVLRGIEDHEHRIRSLERGFWKTMGAISFVTVALPVVFHFWK
jgi:hypothetical protein